MHLKLHKLSLKDKTLIDKFLAKECSELAVYNFANIYIWRKFFDMEWAMINDALCIYFKDKIGAFLYLSPLGNREGKTLQKAFAVLDGLNKNKSFSRIENAEERHIPGYLKLGFDCRKKSSDYICRSKDLAALSGNRFKSKRASLNYFLKHNKFTYFPYLPKDKSACLKLYDLWSSQRVNPDSIYQHMLSDGKVALGEAMENYAELGLEGRLVVVDNELKAFTFGYKLNANTFCILFEITDLSMKGLAQFIFQRFACELKNYQFINIMDDSGLDNLKKVKLSYKPVKIVPAYSVTRKDA